MPTKKRVASGRYVPNTIDCARITARSHKVQRTVEAVYRGENCAMASFVAICDAARQLGLPLPPTPYDGAALSYQPRITARSEG